MYKTARFEKFCNSDNFHLFFCFPHTY
jgi:hypothetical protein